MQTDKNAFGNIRKIYEKFGSTSCLLLSQFHAIIGRDTVSYFLNAFKLVVFERASSGTTSLAEFGSSNITTESVNNEVTKFIQRYVYHGKEVEGIAETRMGQYNEIKTKTRSSRPKVFCKNVVLRNFRKLTGKQLRLATLLKKRLWQRYFPVNFAKFLRTPFFTEHIWWLLLENKASLTQHINPLQPGVAYVYLMKTSEKLKVF